MESREDFGKLVTTKCYECYKKVCRQKKKVLSENEWTNMACIIKTDEKDAIEVISMATGTKCIGESQRTSTGYLLNDSHAEILARRLLLKYLYKQLGLALTTEDNIFKLSFNGKYVLKDGVSFHLFTTEVPCGDASIFPKTIQVEPGCERKRKLSNNDDNLPGKSKRPYVDNNDIPCKDNTIDSMDYRDKQLIDDKIYAEKAKSNDLSHRDKERSDVGTSCKENFIQDRDIVNSKTNTESHSQNLSNNRDQVVVNNGKRSEKTAEDLSKDIHRTGAKCVAGGKQDPLKPGTEYHVTGALRIKPGRGFRTISMSCSDKILKWCCLGIQGGLLSNFVENIYLKSIIVSAPSFNIAAMERALSYRGRTMKNLIDLKRPILIYYPSLFEDIKEAVVKRLDGMKKVFPSGTAILWCEACNIHEYSSNGRKHGVTKKLMDTEKACTSICKKKLLEDFAAMLEKSQSLNTRLKKLKNYYELKHACAEYETKRTEFFTVFHDWTRKSVEDEKFTCNTLEKTTDI